MTENQLSLPNIPYHLHDSDNTPYLGSDTVEGVNYDYYCAPQGGLPTVIARFGRDGDYISGLIFVAQHLDKTKEIMPQLKVLSQSPDETLKLLSRATILSIEQGYLDTNLKALSALKSEDVKTHKKNKP